MFTYSTYSPSLYSSQPLPTPKPSPRSNFVFLQALIFRSVFNESCSSLNFKKTVEQLGLIVFNKDLTLWKLEKVKSLNC